MFPSKNCFASSSASLINWFRFIAFSSFSSSLDGFPTHHPFLQCSTAISPTPSLKTKANSRDAYSLSTLNVTGSPINALSQSFSRLKRKRFVAYDPSLRPCDAHSGTKQRERERERERGSAREEERGENAKTSSSSSSGRRRRRRRSYSERERERERERDDKKSRQRALLSRLLSPTRRDFQSFSRVPTTTTTTIKALSVQTARKEKRSKLEEEEKTTRANDDTRLKNPLPYHLGAMPASVTIFSGGGPAL